MALPTTIFSLAGRPGKHGPWKSSGGSFYAFAIFTGNQISVWKADGDDPADAWTQQDAADRPFGTFNDNVAVHQDGDLLHFAAYSATNLEYRYQQFNMATDNWDVINEQIDNPTNKPTNFWISISVRGDGDVIVAYSGDTDQVMGGKKERVDYARREGGTWTAGIALDAAGDNHYGNPNVVKGPLTDEMHITWQQTANTADPPTAWEQTEGRTLRPSDNSLSTLDTSLVDTINALLGYQNGVSYDDSGTQRMFWCGGANAGHRYIRAQEDAGDDIDILGVATPTLAQGVDVNGEVSITTIAQENGNLHVLFSDNIASDLYYTTSTNNGVDWAGPTEEIDAITVNFISGNIYTRGGDTVFAYVYDDGGVQKYNEKVLVAGGVSGIVKAIINVSSEVLQKKGAEGAPFSVINTLATGSGTHAGSGDVESIIDMLASTDGTKNANLVASAIINMLATVDGSVVIAKSGIVESLIDVAASLDGTPGHQAVAESIINIIADVLETGNRQAVTSAIVDQSATTDGQKNAINVASAIINLLTSLEGSQAEAHSGVAKLLIDVVTTVDETPGRQAVASAIIDILTDALESANRQAVASAIVDVLTKTDGQKGATAVASAIINLLTKLDGTPSEAHSGVAQLLIDAVSMTDGTAARSSTAAAVVDLMANVAETTNRSAVAESIIDQLATVEETANRQAVASAIIDQLVSLIGSPAEVHSGAAKSLIDVMAFGLGRKTAVMTSSQIIDVTVDLSGLANKQQAAQSIIDALAVVAGVRMRSGVVQLLLDLPVDLLGRKGAEAISRSIADLATQAQGQGARSGAAKELIDLLGLVDGLPQRTGLVDERITVAASVVAFVGTPGVIIRTIALTGVFHVDHPLAGLFAPDCALDGKIIG